MPDETLTTETESADPVDGIVLVICDVLHDLSPADKIRALETVRMTLGLPLPVVHHTRREVPTGPLPMVQVRMVGGTPQVVDGQRPDQALIGRAPQPRPRPAQNGFVLPRR